MRFPLASGRAEERMRLAWAVIVAAVAACGGLPEEAEAPVPTASLQQPIINGHDCAADEDPATVAILADAVIRAGGHTQPLKTIICTGTLVAPDTVIAAAHCVDLTPFVAAQ